MATKASGAGETTYLDTEQRVRLAEEMLCEMHTSRHIVETLCATYGIVERTAYAALKLAYDRFAADSANERGIRKARARAAWQKQVRDCKARGDMAGANYAMDKLCKLDGLYEPDKVEITNTTISIEMQIDAVIGVLDSAGLAAFEIVLAQLEAAKARGDLVDVPPERPQLPSGDEAIFDDEPVPIPAKTRGRKRKAATT